jgi:hypothetical protein
MGIQPDHMTAKAITDVPDVHEHRVPIWSWRLAKEMHIDRGRRAARDHGIAANDEPEIRIVGDVVFLTWRREPVTDSAA